MTKILIDEATVKLALEALEHCKDVIVERGLNGNPEFAERWGLTLPLDRSKEAITALKALAEQPAQQEPVVFYRCNGCGHAYGQVHPTSCDCMEGSSFEKVNYYTSPPAQRTRVGLTLEDMETTHWSPDFRAGAKWAAAKLKEKNT